MSNILVLIALDYFFKKFTDGFEIYTATTSDFSRVEKGFKNTALLEISIVEFNISFSFRFFLGSRFFPTGRIYFLGQLSRIMYGWF